MIFLIAVCIALTMLSSASADATADATADVMADVIMVNAYRGWGYNLSKISISLDSVI